MDPQEQFCHNPDCPDRGQGGLGNIRIHSRKEQRYRCSTCRRTFAATTGTPFYRQRTVTEVVTLVLTLLCHGCPLQVIVAAFGFDERTVRAWQALAGEHCQEVHEFLCNRAKWISVMCRPLYRRPAYDVGCN
jgi:transposase-like protein